MRLIALSVVLTTVLIGVVFAERAGIDWSLLKDVPESLHDAMLPGNGSEIKRMIAGGADVNAKDKNGNTPLHLAVIRAQDAVGHLLSVAGVDPNIKNDDGNTPMFVLMEFSHRYYYGGDVGRMVRSLVAAGVDLNEKGNGGSTALHLVSSSATGDTDAIKALVSSGADLSAVDDFGYTPLHTAAAHDEYLKVDSLIVLGAEINARSHNGCTPLDLARDQGNVASAKVILQYGGKSGPCK